MADYRSLAQAAAQRYEVPVDLFGKLIGVESRWNPNARGKAGEIGLTQLMPAAAQDVGVTDRYDPEQNLFGGAHYLRKMYDKFGDWGTAVKAYNAGPGTIEKVLAGRISLPKSTADYHAKIMGGEPATTYPYREPGQEPAPNAQGILAQEPKMDQQTMQSLMQGIIGNQTPQTGFGARLSNPITQFGLGILANNTGNYGQVGPAIAGGLEAAQKAQTEQHKLAMKQLLAQSLIGGLGQEGAGGQPANPLESNAQRIEMIAALTGDPKLYATAQDLRLKARQASPGYIQEVEGIKAEQAARFAPDIKRTGPSGETIYSRPVEMGGGVATEGGSMPTRSATPAEIEQQKGFSKMWVDRYTSALDAQAAAADQLGQVRTMAQTLGDIDTGKFEPFRTSVQSWASGFGMNLSPNLGKKQFYEALTKELALKRKNPALGAGLPGSMSDSDRDFVVAMSGGLGTSKDANKRILAMMAATSKTKIDVAEIMTNYKAKNGFLDEGVMKPINSYLRSNPVQRHFRSAFGQ